MEHTPELTRDQFTVIGKNLEKMESISRPSLTFWQEAWRRIKGNKAAYFSLILLIAYGLLAIFAPMFSKYGFDQQDAYAMSQGISAAWELNQFPALLTGWELILWAVTSGYVSGWAPECP